MQTNENLGPAERIIQSILTYTDHLVHNRPGVVTPDGRINTGIRWEPCTSADENGQTVIYKLVKKGRKNDRVKFGVLRKDSTDILAGNNHVIGRYQPAGILKEIAVWVYRQVAEVWKLDNEFAAHWASFAYAQEHRDLKVVLAAFMLVQSRKGDPVREDEKIAFYDDDFRDVGEAMLLLNSREADGKDAKSKTATKTKKQSPDMSPRMLLRVYDLLSMPEIIAINRELGFTRSARNPQYGRWYKVVQKWLAYREENPKMLQGLIKVGFGPTVRELVRRCGYKPSASKFFEILHWKQAQSKDGRRELAIGQQWAALETWEGQNEEQICQRIVGTKPSWKVIVGKVPTSVGITPAIMSAAIESGCLSSKELIIATPTIEDLGLLKVPDIRARWEKATKEAEDMRAANILQRVRSKETREVLQDAADNAVKKAVEEVIRNIRIYFFVDVSGSMEDAIERAKTHITKILVGFPPDKLHVAIFNTHGSEVVIKHATKAGVENAFRGKKAGGGTDYGSGVRALQHIKPADDEDVIFFFVGDEEAGPFTAAVQASGLRPAAFAFLHVRTPSAHWMAVRGTASQLGIPCIMVDENTFSDPYAIPRTIRALIAATPVSANVGQAAPKRVTLVEEIQKTPLLVKPSWAA
jgi:hypothetical protein